jgi:hypothetical protein
MYCTSGLTRKNVKWPLVRKEILKVVTFSELLGFHIY